MSTMVSRTETRCMAIGQALEAGPDQLTADNYQRAVVAQVEVDTPEHWPLGPIEGVAPTRYMVKGLFEEYIETFKRDDVNPDYHRMARLILPSGVQYEFDEPGAIRRNLKEYGDLSWYLANILAAHGVSLSEALLGVGIDVGLGEIDRLVREDAQGAGFLAWHLPGHNYVFHATNFLDAVREMGRSLPPGDVERFFVRRSQLAATAGRLLAAISVVAQTKFDSSLAGVLYGNLVKVEKRAATGTALWLKGDEREYEKTTPPLLDGVV